jgi:hypothetical protein
MLAGERQNSSKFSSKQIRREQKDVVSLHSKSVADGADIQEPSADGTAVAQDNALVDVILPEEQVSIYPNYYFISLISLSNFIISER